jgi:Family of unknown function (DUF6519)
MTIRNDASRLRLPQRDKRQRRAVVARQGQVLLDTDVNVQAEVLLARVEAEAQAIMGSPGKLVYPAGTNGFAIRADGAPANFNIDAGEGYIDGWRLENPAQVKLNTQLHPRAAALTVPSLIAVKALVRHIDPVEERAMPDVALGDSQASGRSLNDWQVLPIPLTSTTPLTDAAWLAMKAPSTGRLAFKLKAVAGSTDPCSLTPQSGYSRYENLLYRVEVHGGTVVENHPDGPRFALDGLKLKFSRRNASVMARITKVDTNRITVAPPALDPRNWFAPGTCAEIVSIHDDLDPTGALAAERLFSVSVANGDVVTLTEVGAATVTATTAVAPAAGAESDWFLRLWDMLPTATGTSPSGIATVAAPGNATDSAEIDLGDGVVIQLTGGAAARFRRGDYWTCAVRADGTIAWTQGAVGAVGETPHGPEVRYAPLAAITNLGIVDLRVPLATLTDRALLYRGGDGQLARLNTGANPVELPAKLRVAVMRGETPVPKAQVRWQIAGPAGSTGTLSGDGQTGTALTLLTNDDGLSEVIWAVDSGFPDVAHTVSADLLDGVQPGTPPIHFTAQFDREGSHGGCSTYVVEENSKWVELLENMDFSQDIAVCFQRGLFKTNRKVVLKGERSIKISGAGDGTVILGTSGETALELHSFASAVVERLRIETRDNKTPIRKLDKFAGRGGSLTLRECTIAEVRSTTLRCGGQLVTGRTALTIAGKPETKDEAAVPIKLARVIDNRILSGFLQDGILITDCDNATVTNNELVAINRSVKLSDAVVMDSPGWRNAMARALLNKVEVFERAVEDTDVRVIKMGRLEARFASVVPQADWDKMVATTPFERADAATEDELVLFIENLAAKAADDPDAAPASAANFVREAARRGSTSTPEVRRSNAVAAILPGRVEVGLTRRRRPGRPSNELVATGNELLFGDFGVRLDSPVSGASWAQAYNDNAVYPRGKARDGWTLAEQIRAVARIMAGDHKMRTRVAEFERWHKAFVGAPTQAAARQAITCGGAVLGNVSITGNRAFGFAQGAHVGASVKSDRGVRAVPNVRISDNDFALRPLSRVHYWSSALFVGNCETVRIDRNNLTQADPNLDFQQARHGIRVWGWLGHYLMIAENRVDVAGIGIKVRAVNHTTPKNNADCLWLARDNLVTGVGGGHSNVIHADPLVEDRNNRPL